MAGSPHLFSHPSTQRGIAAIRVGSAGTFRRSLPAARGGRGRGCVYVCGWVDRAMQLQYSVCTGGKAEGTSLSPPHAPPMPRTWAVFYDSEEASPSRKASHEHTYSIPSSRIAHTLGEGAPHRMNPNATPLVRVESSCAKLKSPGSQLHSSKRPVGSRRVGRGGGHRRAQAVCSFSPSNPPYATEGH